MVEKSPFGSLQTLSIDKASITFIVTLVVIILLEYFSKFLDKVTEKHNLTELHTKLQYELMLLGIISFLLFVIQVSLSNDIKFIDQEYLVSFEVIHIIISFIALSFVAQAILLAFYAKYDANKLLKIIRLPETDLLKDYDKIINTKKSPFNLLSWFKQRAGVSKSHLWRKVEMKILEGLFFNCHSDMIPNGFNYGHYISHLYYKYLATLGNFSPVSWFFLVLTVLLNFIKNQFYPADRQCRVIYKSPVHASGIHYTSDDTTCINMYFIYPLICGMVILFVLCFVLVASNYYYHVFVREGIRRVFQIDTTAHHRWCQMSIQNAYEYITCSNHLSLRHQCYLDCLEKLQERRSQIAYSTAHQPYNFSSGAAAGTSSSATSQKQQQQAQGNLSQQPSQQRFTLRRQSSIESMARSSFHQQKSFRNSVTSSRYSLQSVEPTESHVRLTQSESLYVKHLEHLEQEKNLSTHKKHIELLQAKKSSYCHRFIVSILNTFKTQKYKQGNPELMKYFLFHNSTYYFFMVEFMFLAQSFYLSIYFTQLLPLAVTLGRADWAGILAICPIIGFFVLRLILSKSVILHSTIRLKKEIMIQVSEETKDTIKLCKYILSKMNNIWEKRDLYTVKERMEYMKAVYDYIDIDQNGHLDKLEFRQFLGELEMYLSKDKFTLLWNVMDDNLSGEISKDEMLFFFFPEEKLALQKESILIYKLSKILHSKFKEEKIPYDKWKLHLTQILNVYDTEKMGLFDTSKIRQVFIDMNIKANDKDISHLIHKLNPNNEGKIYLINLVELIMSSDIMSRKHNKKEAQNSDSMKESARQPSTSGRSSRFLSLGLPGRTSSARAMYDNGTIQQYRLSTLSVPNSSHGINSARRNSIDNSTLHSPKDYLPPPPPSHLFWIHPSSPKLHPPTTHSTSSKEQSQEQTYTQHQEYVYNPPLGNTTHSHHKVSHKQDMNNAHYSDAHILSPIEENPTPSQRYDITPVVTVDMSRFSVSNTTFDSTTATNTTTIATTRQGGCDDNAINTSDRMNTVGYPFDSEESPVGSNLTSISTQLIPPAPRHAPPQPPPPPRSSLTATGNVPTQSPSTTINSISGKNSVIASSVSYRHSASIDESPPFPSASYTSEQECKSTEQPVIHHHPTPSFSTNTAATTPNSARTGHDNTRVYTNISPRGAVTRENSMNNPLRQSTGSNLSSLSAQHPVSHPVSGNQSNVNPAFMTNQQQVQYNNNMDHIITGNSLYHHSYMNYGSSFDEEDEDDDDEDSSSFGDHHIEYHDNQYYPTQYHSHHNTSSMSSELQVPNSVYDAPPRDNRISYSGSRSNMSSSRLQYDPSLHGNGSGGGGGGGGGSMGETIGYNHSQQQQYITNDQIVHDDRNSSYTMPISISGRRSMVNDGDDVENGQASNTLRHSQQHYNNNNANYNNNNNNSNYYDRRGQI